MNAEEFVNALRIVVGDAAVSITMKRLVNPGGKSPEAKLLERSTWYQGLDELDKTRVHEVVLDAVNTTVFGFLCAIDGVYTVKAHDATGKFELWYFNEETSELLNPQDGAMLHDLW